MCPVQRRIRCRIGRRIRRHIRRHMAELATRDGWAILQPTGTDASLELLCEWCRQRRASLRATLFSESALLLRGWEVKHVSQAEAIIFEELDGMVCRGDAIRSLEDV